MKRIIIFVFLACIALSNAKPVLANLFWQQPVPALKPLIKKTVGQKALDQANAELDSLQLLIIANCKESVVKADNFIVKGDYVEIIIDNIDYYEGCLKYWNDFLWHYNLSVKKDLPKDILNLRKYKQHLFVYRDSDGSIAASLKNLSGVDFLLEVSARPNPLPFIVFIFILLFLLVKADRYNNKSAWAIANPGVNVNAWLALLVLAIGIILGIVW